LEALVSEFRRLDQTIESIRHLKSPHGFAQATKEAVNASLYTSNVTKIKRFAAILGFSVTHQEENTDWDEVASYIRDIAQLSDQDIEALKILYSACKLWALLLPPNNAGQTTHNNDPASRFMLVA
jgi:hypothetical protein